MVDLNEDFFLEHRIEARVARLTNETNSLIRLDSDRFNVQNFLTNEVESIKQQLRELIFIVNKLTHKYDNFKQYYEIFSSKTIKIISSIQNRIEYLEKSIDDLVVSMGQLSLN